MNDQNIQIAVTVKRGKQELGKSKMRFCEGAYTAVDLQRLYLPVVASRALSQAVENGMRSPDGTL